MQVVACHVFHDAPAAFCLRSFSRHKFHAQAEIAGAAVGVAQRRTGIRGDDPANRRAVRRREPPAAGIVFSRPACAANPRFARPARRRGSGRADRRRARDSSGRDRAQCRSAQAASRCASFVRPPVGITANFSAAAKRRISAIWAASAGRTMTAGRMPQTSRAAISAASVMTCAPPTISSRRVKEACAGRLMRESPPRPASAAREFLRRPCPWAALCRDSADLRD